MFFIFQREPCNPNNGCLHICRNFIFIGKIKVNLNSNPFGYLAAYVRCLQFTIHYLFSWIKCCQEKRIHSNSTSVARWPTLHTCCHISSQLKKNNNMDTWTWSLHATYGQSDRSVKNLLRTNLCLSASSYRLSLSVCCFKEKKEARSRLRPSLCL